jgi:hypothetical protein
LLPFFLLYLFPLFSLPLLPPLQSEEDKIDLARLQQGPFQLPVASNLLEAKKEIKDEPSSSSPSSSRPSTGKRSAPSTSSTLSNPKRVKSEDGATTTTTSSGNFPFLSFSPSVFSPLSLSAAAGEGEAGGVGVAVKKEKLHAKPTAFNEVEIKKMLRRKGKLKPVDLIKKFKHLLDTEDKKKAFLATVKIAANLVADGREKFLVPKE